MKKSDVCHITVEQEKLFVLKIYFRNFKMPNLQHFCLTFDLKCLSLFCLRAY